MHEGCAGCVCATEHQGLRLFEEAATTRGSSSAVSLRSEKFMIDCSRVRELSQFSRIGCDFFDLGFEELIAVSRNGSGRRS